MATIATAGPREAMRKHPTFQTLAKGLLYKSRGRVMIALPVKLAAARFSYAFFLWRLLVGLTSCKERY
jgi:hypothetical protein